VARPQQISDRQIDEAARACFLAHGAGVPVEVIARRLGVTAAALFLRAGSKEALLRRALSTPAPPPPPALARPPAPGAARRGLEEILLGLLAALHHVVPALLVLRAAGLPPSPSDRGPPPPVAHRRRLAAWLRRVPAAEGRPAQPRIAADLLLGALEARCFNRHLGGRAFAPGDDRAFVRSLARAVLAAPAPRGRRS
jgi:AcrR family transcriptional regulator